MAFDAPLYFDIAARFFVARDAGALVPLDTAAPATLPVCLPVPGKVAVFLVERAGAFELWAAAAGWEQLAPGAARGAKVGRVDEFGRFQLAAFDELLPEFCATCGERKGGGEFCSNPFHLAVPPDAAPQE